MAYEMKEGQVTLFKNKNKKEDRHPEYKGEIMINGVLQDIALWVKESAKGEKYFSGKVSAKLERTEQPSEPKKITKQGSDDLLF